MIFEIIWVVLKSLILIIYNLISISIISLFQVLSFTLAVIWNTQILWILNLPELVLLVGCLLGILVWLSFRFKIKFAIKIINNFREKFKFSRVWINKLQRKQDELRQNWQEKTKDKGKMKVIGTLIVDLLVLPIRLIILLVSDIVLRIVYPLKIVNHQRRRFFKEKKPFLRFKTWRSFFAMGIGFNLGIVLLTDYLVSIIRAIITCIYLNILNPKNLVSFDWTVLRWTNLFNFSVFWVSPVLAIPLSLIGAWVVWKSAWINWEQYRDYNNNESGDDRFATLSEVKRQYYLAPDRQRGYSGESGIPILHLNKLNLAGLTLGTLMRYRSKKVTDFLQDLMQKTGVSKLVTGTYLLVKEPINIVVNGTTRSGKGESLVNPSIDTISRAKTKSSLVVTDPKGEIYQASYKTLRKRGYNVQVLSFQDMDWSMSYDPLALAKEAAKHGYYEKVQERVNAVAEAIYRKSKGGFTKGNEKYWEDTAISLFNAITIALIDRANETYNSDQEKDAWDTVTVRNVAKFLIDLGSEVVPVNDNGEEVVNPDPKIRYKTKSKLTLYFDQLRKINDKEFSKFREMADINLRNSDFASEETKGNIYSSMLSGINLFLQDNIARLTSKNSLDLESVGNPRRLQVHFRSSRMKGEPNLYVHQAAYISIYQTGYSSKVGIKGKRKYFVRSDKVLLDGNGYLNYVIQKPLSDKFIIEINFNDRNNRREIINDRCKLAGRKRYSKDKNEITGRYELKDVKVDIRSTQGLFELDEFTDINLIYSDKPTALFLVTPPNRSEYNSMSSLLVDQLFNANYEVALKAGRKTSIRIQFILDEFGNLPPIPKMSEKLNIGLGQNIQFMLFVQELTQLVDKYGKETADGILAACSLNILIKAIVKDTLSFYSEQLGKKTITKRGKSTNILDEANPNISTENPEQDLMTVTQLRNLQAGEMVIIRGVKTMDRYGKKVTPDPIFAHGKTEMPYRYMFLNKEFDQSMTLSDIPVESKHRNLDLRQVALDSRDVYEQLKAWRSDLGNIQNAKLRARKNLYQEYLRERPEKTVEDIEEIPENIVVES